MKYVHITGDHIDEGMDRLERLRASQKFAGFFPFTPAETSENEGIGVMNSEGSI